MSEIIDITWHLDGDVLTYPSDPRFTLASFASIPAEGYSMQTISMGSHTGTHVDAPAHFLTDGLTAERLPLEILCGEALVVDAKAAGKKINARFLSNANLSGVSRLLLRTTNEKYLPSTFTEEYAHLTEDAAAFLRNETAVRLVGIDYISIETGSNLSFPVHRILLTQQPPILILEGIDLHKADPGVYDLVCLPLLIVGGDGAPARAILRRR